MIFDKLCQFGSNVLGKGGARSHEYLVLCNLLAQPYMLAFGLKDITSRSLKLYKALNYKCANNTVNTQADRQLSFVHHRSWEN